MTRALDLRFREYGGTETGRTPLVLVHGLFGSSANWHGVARRLAAERRVLVPDLRNHGDSPWDGRMDYPSMAADLMALLDRLGIVRAHLAGHSMGGKAAMWLALSTPDRVGSLVVADMAPVTYPTRHGALVDTLARLPLDAIRNRRDADARLAPDVPSAAVRGYLLQSLIRVRDSGRDGHNRWRWRVNLPALARSMDLILGFPEAGNRSFPGAALFVYGGRSGYVSSEGLPRIRTLFPLARLRAIPEAGHWVYADQPEAFTAAVAGFLGD
jgi:esterase